MDATEPGKELFQKVDGSEMSSFVMGGFNQGFVGTSSASGRLVFYQSLDVLPSDMTLSLVTSLRDRRRKDIRVEVGPSDQSDRVQQAMPE